MNPEGAEQYWLTPARSSDLGTAEAVIRNLVGGEHMFVFGNKTPGRKSLKPGDWICFYAAGKGVVAHAKVVSVPEEPVDVTDWMERTHGSTAQELVREMIARFPLAFRLDQVQLYTGNPVVIDVELRAKLEAFIGRDLSRGWSWLVVATHRISRHDFELLTRTR